MTNLAIMIRHQTKPGARDDVQRVWLRHMAPAVAANEGHVAYFYCFDEADADAITAFQVYTDAEASAAFLKTDAYAAYLAEVEPLLTGPPQVSELVPVWSKN
jgi:quinol monooxygenase YgiN